MTAATSGNPLAIRKHESHLGTHFVGTAADLIAAGLAELHQFPGQPGRGTCMASYAADGAPVQKGCSKRISPRSKYLQIARRSQSMFCVLVYWSQDACDARSKRQKALQDLARRERERCATLELSKLPKSAGEFRAFVVARLDCLGFMVQYFMAGRGGGSGGYSFDKADQLAFESSMVAARAPLLTGGIAFDPARRTDEEATIRDNLGTPQPTAPPAKPRRTLRLVASTNAAMGVREAGHV